MEDKEINSYNLSRNWFDFCFENPELIKPIHTAIYFFAIEHCNRLGWKDKFGFPSQMVMEAIGVKNWRTYSSALNEIVDFGFIKMIEISKNQYSSNVIAIVKNTKASTKALDKALSKHSQKQHTKHSQSTVSIDKQETINKEQKETNNNILLSQVDESTLDQTEKKYYQIAFSFFELVKSSLKELSISVAEIEKAKYKTWVDPIRLLIENDKRTVEEFREIFSFLQKDEFWKEQIRSTAKLRKKNKDERTYFEVLLEKSRNGQRKQQQQPSVNGSQSNSGVSPEYKESILRRLYAD